MKKKLILILAINSLCISAQQGGVGIGTTNPDPSAALDITATNKGIQLPLVALTSTVDITAVANPKTGFIVYNTATAGTGNTSVTKGLYAYNGTVWEKMWSKQEVKTEVAKIPFITPVFAASNIAASGSIVAGTITNLTFNTLDKDFPAGAQGSPAYTGYRVQTAGGYVISFNVDVRNVSGDTNGGAMVYVQKNGVNICSYGTDKRYQFGGVSSTCSVKLVANDLITFRVQSSNAAYQITNPNVSISKISNN